MTENDPNGKAPHEPGAKLDDGKPRVGLMLRGFAKALLEVAKVTTYGANKYSPNGWKLVPDGINRYDDALCRHLLKDAYEEYSEDDQLLHKAQMVWNALAELQLYIEEKEKRPKYEPLSTEEQLRITNEILEAYGKAYGSQFREICQQVFGNNNTIGSDP